MRPYVMFCTIWYHLYSLKNMKNTHGGVIVLVKLQAAGCNFTKTITTTWVLLTLLYKWYRIALSASYPSAPSQIPETICLQELHILKIFIITVVCIYYLSRHALTNILPGNTLVNIFPRGRQLWWFRADVYQKINQRDAQHFYWVCSPLQTLYFC